MPLASILFVLVAILVILLVAYVARYVIDGFFPEPLRLPALAIVGVILLLSLLWYLLGHFGVMLAPMR